MSLAHALLTALLERPCSGLELARRFDHSIGYFWNATHQQIYRELGKLEEEGWVASSANEGSRGRKKTYKVLPSGKRELKRWIVQRDIPKPYRDPLMVRLRAEAIVGPTTLRDDLARDLQKHQELYDIYQAYEARDFSDEDQSRETVIRHLILTCGLMHQRFWIDWHFLALSELDRLRRESPAQ